MITVLVFALSLQGCDFFGGDAGKEATVEAQAQMKTGDVVGAAEAFRKAAEENPKSVDAATGAALAALMRGDTSAADEYLAGVLESAGERKPEVLMRRAMVAQQARDWDSMREYGEASGIDAGLLMAGEAALADGDREDAEALFSRVGGSAGDVAQGYLDLLGSDDPIIAGLSEAQALWALGLRKVAVRSVGDLLTRYPGDAGDRDEQLLVWASRAATVRETATAKKLIAEVKASGDRVWRRDATLAIAECADGKAKACIRAFDRLEGDAPEDGLADAKVTAAALIAETDPKTAKALAGVYRSDGAARALYAAGARNMAVDAAPPGPLSDFVGD
jgi:tetratricopeptide (TPR) repeat protein